MPIVGIGPGGGSTPTPASTAGTTWARYWALLAAQLCLYENDLTVAEQAAFEPRRNVIVDRLRDDDAARDMWAGAYLYGHVTEASGTQAKILSQGYHGQFGVLQLADPPLAEFQTGAALELSSPLPIKTHNATKGVAALVNEALARTWLPARLTLTGNGTRSQDLSAYPYIRQPQQLQGVYDNIWGPAGDPLELSYAGYRLDLDGQTRTLVTDLTYTTADTFQVAVLVRGDSLVFDGTDWLYPATPGLTADNYQAAAPEHWVTTIGMVKGLQELRKLNAREKLLLARNRTIGADERKLTTMALSDQAAEIERNMAAWAPAAKRIVMEEFPQPVQAPHDSFIGVADLATSWY